MLSFPPSSCPTPTDPYGRLYPIFPLSTSYSPDILSLAILPCPAPSTLPIIPCYWSLNSVHNISPPPSPNPASTQSLCFHLHPSSFPSSPPCYPQSPTTTHPIPLPALPVCLSLPCYPQPTLLPSAPPPATHPNPSPCLTCWSQSMCRIPHHHHPPLSIRLSIHLGSRPHKQPMLHHHLPRSIFHHS